MSEDAQHALHFAEIGASHQYKVEQWREDVCVNAQDNLAEEVPVAMVYNGVSHAVMLATPQDLDDFGLGFSLSEGILQHPKELYDINVTERSQGVELQMTIASERFQQLKERRRNLAGRTGCGLCGAESLSEVFRLPASPRVHHEVLNVESASLLKAHRHMRDGQRLQKLTGATHACAWSSEDGNIGLVREDVGRHNALDKLIGALCKQNIQGGFIITTSRASYEMVQKVVMAGYQMLSAISAPTGLAVRMANDYRLTLLGFVRDNQYVVYTHPSRIKHAKQSIKVNELS
jgi:FdhD protein